jgi:Rod binding domain-containing protein
MELAALNRTLRPSDVPLEELATSSKFTEPEKVAEGCRHFEAILLRQILRDSQKNLLPSKILPESLASDIYRDMITEQMADNISRSGHFGLAHSLNQQVSHPNQKPTHGETASSEFARPATIHSSNHLSKK